MRTKRTYNLPERTVVAVRELAATYGLASTQDGVIELAVDELARRLREETEGERWAEAAGDPTFGRQPKMMLAARAHPKIRVEIRFVERRVAALALDPNPFGDGLFRLFGEPLRARPPGHRRHCCPFHRR